MRTHILCIPRHTYTNIQSMLGKPCPQLGATGTQFAHLSVHHAHKSTCSSTKATQPLSYIYLVKGLEHPAREARSEGNDWRRNLAARQRIDCRC